jgi:hypothetical protein
MKRTVPRSNRTLRADVRRLAAPLAMLIGLICALAPPASPAREPVAPVRNFAVTERSGEVGFEYDYLSETQQRDDADELKYTNHTMQEYLLYRVNGYVYHPRFLDYRTRFKIGLLQQSIDRAGGLDAGDGDGKDATLWGYNIYLHFLKEHPLSLLLIASRERDAIIELFSDRQLIESERHGAILNWKKGPFPMDLSVTRNRVREWGVDSFSETTYDVLEYSIRNAWKDRMLTELRYRFLDYEQDFEASNRQVDIERSTELKSHDVSLTNTIYFDGDRAGALTSTARYFKQTGSQEFELINWQERLNLRHSATLQTYYLFNLLENRFPETDDVRTLRGEAGVDHQLFRSLRTHFDVHGRRVTYDGSGERQYGGTLRFNYRKRTAWGHLTAGYGNTLDRIERDGISGRRPIVDESVTLNDGVTVFLGQPAIVRGSIVVASADQTVIYDETFDYEIVEVGNRIGLRLVVGGRIADGDTVLVDYSIAFTQDIEYYTDSQDFYVRHEFDKVLRGVALYYRRQQLDAYDAPEQDMTILEFTDWAAGAEYNWRWLRVAGEIEEYRSNFSEYDQTSGRVEGCHRLRDGIRLGWHVGVIQIDYLDDDIEDDHSDAVYAGLSLDGRFDPGRHLTGGYWSVEARARDETGQIEETVLGLVAKLGLRWRRLRLEAGGRFEERERFNSTRDRAQVFLRVAREFGGREAPEW